MKPIIEVEHIEKNYQIGSLHSYQTLREQLISFFKSHSKKVYIKALDDVSFSVFQGEKIAIIGKNGAGKSTLLKILSRITPPSRGQAVLRGKVVSLLEVGTGFHGELTGRENIFLNGAILGMKRQEIQKKLDEIVAFSGLEKFLDTPVKHYSSGMQTKLAFSVAAHLDNDILLVDEVLAVGDAEFQKKSLGKMKDLSSGGRTVLFVSHNMAAVKSLCSKGILLENGKIKTVGIIDEVISSYFKEISSIPNYRTQNDMHLERNGFRLSSIGIRKKEGSFSDVIKMDDEIELVCEYEVEKGFKELHLTYHFKNEQGEILFTTSGAERCYPLYHEKGKYRQTCLIPANLFNFGNFYIDFYVVENKKFAFIIEHDILSFTIVSKELSLGSWMNKEPGDFAPVFHYIEEKVH